MDPSHLPLEIFVSIFQHLPSINTWQYQIVSRSWYEALSSSIAITSALKYRLDFEHFKNHHLSRPVSLASIVPERPYRWFQLAYNDECLAYFRHPTDSHESPRYELIIHDLVLCTTRVVSIGAVCPSELVIGDVLAFRHGQTLYTITKEGETRTREMVGEVNGPIEIHDSIIAMLPDQGGMDDFFQQFGHADALPEVLYIYDYAKDIFEIKQLSALRPEWARIRGLLLSGDDILVISISALDCREDPVRWVISVRSLNGRDWSAEYSVPAKSHWCWHWSVMHLSSQFNGISYDISVAGEKAHTITITLDGFVACQEYLTAQWYNDVYKVVEFGIESNNGFICHDVSFNVHYRRRSSSLHLSERYMVLTEQLHSTGDFNGIVGIHVFRFGGAMRHWSHDMIWEDREADPVAQAKRRSDVVWNHVSDETLEEVYEE